MRKSTSLQDVLKRRQTGEFVGREEQLALFRQSLTLPPDDELRRFVFNVWGQGGVGKTSLLRQFRNMARNAGAVSAWVDESEGDLVAVMVSIARQFAEQGFPLPSFDTRYRRYVQRDAAVPSGASHVVPATAQPAAPTSDPAAKAPDRSQLRRQLAEQFSDDELRDVCFDLEIDYESLAGETKSGKVRQLILHAERQNRTADLVQTVQQHRPSPNPSKAAHRQHEPADWPGEDPNFSRRNWAAGPMRSLIDKEVDRTPPSLVDVLTPALLEALRALPESRVIIFFFDTYERTGGYLDQWLREVLHGRYGDVPSNIMLTIAGRHGLDHNHWSPYDGLITSLPLDPFSEEEARAYLERKGITDARVVEMILQLSGRLPLLVATLARGNLDDPAQVNDPSDTALGRFLKWEDDSRRRQAAIDAALPRRLNRDVLAALAGEHDADGLFIWLRGMPFVIERTQGWTYHDVVREQMLRHQRRHSPQTFAERHGQLVAYYEGCCAALGLDEDKSWKDDTWQTYALEALYHRLCCSPHRELSDALNGFLAALKARRTFARQWAETMQQAGSEADVSEVRRWGDQLVEGLQAYDEHHYDAAIGVFWQLLEIFHPKPKQRAVALAYRGQIYLLLGLYAEALQDLFQALELDPQSAWALTQRGVVYRFQGDYLAALADFDRALELDPQSAWALAQRGTAYRLQGDYIAALANLDRSVELDSQSAWTLAQRGETHRQMGNYAAALADLGRALTIDPQYTWALTGQGEMYLLQGNYTAALANFEQALELNSEKDWYSYSRALTYQLLNQHDEAEKDLTTAIRLAQQEYENDPQYWRNTFNLALYHLASGNMGTFEQLYREGLSGNAPAERIDEAIRDLNDFLVLFPEHPQAREMRALLQQYLDSAAAGAE